MNMSAGVQQAFRMNANLELGDEGMRKITEAMKSAMGKDKADGLDGRALMGAVKWLVENVFTGSLVTSAESTIIEFDCQKVMTA